VKQSGIVNGFDLAFWSGVTTLQFAKTLFEIIENNEITGLIHLTNNDKISKFDLLTIIKEVFKLDFIEIHSNSEYKVDKSLINSRSDFKLIVPDYYIMIEELKKWIFLHPNLYSKYYTTLFK
jgi:dTDP-4-dehydrorhamnose reductase